MDDDFGVFERFEDMFRDCARFVAVAGVEGWLAAAGLRRREIDCDAEALEDVDHGHAGFGVNHIDDAGDEEGDGFADGRFSRGQCHAGRFL